jgi:hypothetical protein
MRNRGSVSRCAIVVLCVAALGMLGMDGQDSGPLVTKPAHLKPALDPSIPSIDPDPTIENGNGWICVERNTCPSGLLKGFDRNYIGCELWTNPVTGAALGCTGGCLECSGAVVSIALCEERPLANCVPLNGGIGPNVQVNCGVTTKHPDCQYHAAPPAPLTVTPNGCYCFGTAIPTSDPCMVTGCELVFGEGN